MGCHAIYLNADQGAPQPGAYFAPMKITEIREVTKPIASSIRNAYIDFSKMTLSLVAVVTDVVRDGKRVIGYGFNSNGRYGQGGLIRERFAPRLMEAAPKTLLGSATTSVTEPGSTRSTRRTTILSVLGLRVFSAPVTKIRTSTFGASWPRSYPSFACAPTCWSSKGLSSTACLSESWTSSSLGTTRSSSPAAHRRRSSGSPTPSAAPGTSSR